MADEPQQGFLSPLLHGSSYIRDRNICIRNILQMPLHQVNGNPTRNNMDNSSTNSGATIVKDGSQQQTSNHSSLSIIRGASKGLLYTAVAPITRVQFLMQCQNELIKTGRLSNPYKGMKDCFLRTIKHEGVSSLWRGNALPVSICALEALLFPVPGLFSGFPGWDKSGAPSSMFPVALLLLTYLDQYPFLYARVRLANDVKPPPGRMHFSLDSSTAKWMTNNAGNNRQFSGTIDVIKKTFMGDGFRSLYRGFTPAFIGIFAALQTGHATKECITAYTKEKQNQKTHKLLANIALNLMTSVSIPLAVYPFSTVSYRMMMTSGEANKYKGPTDALYQIVRKEGVSSLYKGATPHIISQMARTSIAAMLFYFVPISKIAVTKSDASVSILEAVLVGVF